MSTIREDHRQAIDLAERAFVAQRLGDHTHARELFRQAFEYERQAAESVASDLAAEPTRSVLLRSAATLALDCGKIREAERLAAIGLWGDPPPEIAEELRDVIEQAAFCRHLDLRGITLEPTEFQFSIAGRAVGPGITYTADFVDRVESISKLIYRTAERQRGQPFREQGPMRKAVRHDFELFMSAPRVGSFAVTFKLGRIKEQLQIVGTLDTSEVIDETLYCLELLDSSDLATLRQRIPQEAYYRNFVSLARRVAPDGDHVKTVGFTTTRGARERTVRLTRHSDDILTAVEAPPLKASAERITITGELQFADGRSTSKCRIRVVEQDGTQHNVLVPEGLMADIVRPLWGERVSVTGTKGRKGIKLEDIQLADVE